MIEVDFETKKTVVMNAALACFVSFGIGFVCGLTIMAVSL